MYSLSLTEKDLILVPGSFTNKCRQDVGGFHE